jgi:hypothetical protein
MVFAVSDVVSDLVFPLVVLVVGALVTGLLIPMLARRRDRHLKALDVKTALVSDISETVLKFVMAIQFAVLESQLPKNYAEAYRTWEVETGVLHTKLEAYFPGKGIVQDWESLEAHLRTAYGLSENGKAARASWGDAKATALAKKKALIAKVLKSRAAGLETKPAS